MRHYITAALINCRFSVKGNCSFTKKVYLRQKELGPLSSATSQSGLTLSAITGERMRKHLLSLLFTFMTFNSFSQSIESINSNLKIPNKLDQSKEIRIYKRFSTTNATEIFRFYKTEQGAWNVEFYKYFDEIPGVAKLHFESSKIESKNDLNLVWLYFLDNDIASLPSLKEIDYKLKSKGEIIWDRNEYDIIWKKKTPLDGIGYEAYFKDGEKRNSFDFGNYDSYLTNYPTVDELISYSEIMKLLNKEFNLWK